MKKIFILYLLIIIPHLSAQENNLITKNQSGETISGVVDIGKCKIHYDMRGEGTPLILIHGGFLDKRMWNDQFLEFSKYFKVIEYDLRKYGLSKSEPDTFSHHEDLSLLMDKLGIKKAVIMGLSMGGYISIDFTLTHPEKVLALIPVSSGLTGYKVVDKQYMELLKKWEDIKTIEEGVELLQQYLTDGPYRKPEQVNPLVREKIRQMYTENILADTNLAFKEVKTDPPAIKRLVEINVPTLTIFGDLDGSYIFEIANMIIKDVKGAKKYIIKDAAHYVNMEKPEEFNKAVIDFINTLKDK